MSERSRPRRLRLPRSRALCVDVLHYHRKVPTCAHDRICDLSPVAEARENAAQRISWSLLFIKAFGLVAANRPVLRQVWFSLPWPHLYEHPETIAMMATHRDFRGEQWLFWSRFSGPERRSLADLQSTLDEYKQAPVEEIFERQYLFSALPTPLRRLIWAWNLNVSGQKRVKRTGTCFLTTIAGSGAEIQHPPAFLTTNMTYGPLDERNRSRVTIAYDHRLMDGLYIAETLAELEETLNGPIVAELQALGAKRRAA